MKKILPRADDLGYSEAVNYSTEKSVKEGLISSLGIMVNIPATQHGIGLIKDCSLAFGVHTNVCTGKPLTNPGPIPSLVDENGNFKSSKQLRAAKEDLVVSEEVVLEIGAQYQKSLALFGRQPDYFGGHAVVSINFFKGLGAVTEKHDLEYSGFLTGDAPLIIGNSLVQFNMGSMASHYEPFNVLKRMVVKADDHVVQLAVFHPGYLDDNILTHSSLTIPRIQGAAILTNPDVKQWFREQDAELIDYRDLQNGICWL